MREYTYQLRLIMFTIAFWTMAAFGLVSGAMAIVTHFLGLNTDLPTTTMLISLVGMIVWKHSIDTFYYDDPLSKLPR